MLFRSKAIERFSGAQIECATSAAVRPEEHDDIRSTMRNAENLESLKVTVWVLDHCNPAIVWRWR